MPQQPEPKPGIAQNMLEDRQSLPGMIPQEIVIFKAWWAIHHAEYSSADFNVRVGFGFDPGPAFDTAVRTSTIANSQRRIDAVLSDGHSLIIAEVKYRATPLAIGQLVVYRLLYLRDHPEVRIPGLMLIYLQTDADTLFLGQALGVNMQQQQADFTGIKVTKQG